MKARNTLHLSVRAADAVRGTTTGAFTPTALDELNRQSGALTAEKGRKSQKQKNIDYSLGCVGMTQLNLAIQSEREKNRIITLNNAYTHCVRYILCRLHNTVSAFLPIWGSS